MADDLDLDVDGHRRVELKRKAREEASMSF